MAVNQKASAMSAGVIEHVAVEQATAMPRGRPPAAKPFCCQAFCRQAFRCQGLAQGADRPALVSDERHSATGSLLRFPSSACGCAVETCIGGASNIFKSADRRDSLSHLLDIDIDSIPTKRPVLFSRCRVNPA
jgi:hypothetical protein